MAQVPEGLKVAYLLPSPGIPIRGPSGASAHARNLVRAMGEDHDVKVFTAKISDDRGVHGDPVPSVACGTPAWPKFLGRYRDMVEVSAARRIAERLRVETRNGWQPDLVVERHTLFSDAGWRVHEALDVPWVLEVNAPPVLERERFDELRRPRWARRWEHRVLQAAPAIVTVSRWLEGWLRDEVGCRNVHWVPNGATPLRGSRDRGREILGVEDDGPIVGFVGSMKPWHGVDRLPAIAEALDAKLALIGKMNSPMEGALCPGHLGPQALADVVAALDVGLAPYPADAPPWFCPLKILDYRAQGTPVVATDIGECEHLVGAGGTVVAADDDAAIIEAARGWLGKRTDRRVRSWHRVAKQVLGVGLGISV